MSSAIYTYQGGKKLALSCATTHFVSRAGKERLLEEQFSPIHELSPHSWCVRTSPDRLQEDLVRARRLGPAYPAYIVEGSGAGFHVTDRIAIRFRREVSDRHARELGDWVDLEVVRRLTPRDFLFRVPHMVDVVDVVRNLTERHLRDVEFIDHDLNIRPHLQEAVASEPDAMQQWHLLSTIDDPLIHTRALMDCEGAWEAAGFGDPNVVIGVIDSGCDLSDPNFGPGKFADWAVLLDGELLRREHLPTDVDGSIMNPPRVHGTLCATLIAASINSFGGVGVAPRCRLLPIKCQRLGDAIGFSESLFFDVLNYLRDKVDVVSNSWNPGTNGFWPPYVVDRLRDVALNGGRNGNGMVWVWSAGNWNCPILHTGDVAIPIKVGGDGDTLAVTASSQTFTNELAGLPGVLIVGAISSVGQRCHYSNYGKGLDLVAPSGNFHLYGRGTATGVPVLAPLGERGLYSFRGTSAAAPLVAGVAALVRSVNPSLTSTEIVSILRRTADRDLDMTGYPSSGRPTDPDPAWDISPISPFQSGEFVSNGNPDGPWSPWFGFGKVNARKAVQEASRLRSRQPN